MAGSLIYFVSSKKRRRRAAGLVPPLDCVTELATDKLRRFAYHGCGSDGKDMIV